MASTSSVSNRVTEDLIRSGVTQEVKERLSTVFLVDSLTDPFQWRCQVFLLRVRASGFMCLLPSEPSVQHALSQVEQTAGFEERCAITEVDVDVDSAKGKHLGTISMFIADIPWSYLGLFRKVQLKAGGGTPIYSFRFGTSLARPNLASAEAVAERWIGDVLDADAAREYTTAEEGVDLPEAASELLGDPVGARREDVEALYVRIAQLESLLQAQTGAVMPAAPTVTADQGGHTLFAGARRDGLSAAEWAKLHRAAGAAPKRIAKAEHATPVAQAEHPMVQTLRAEEDREVGDPDAEDELEAELSSSLQAVQDPTHRLLLLQMKQTHAIMKTLAPKTAQDPFTSLLGGSDSGSGGSSAGSLNVKGYAARELYLRHLEEDAKVVEVIRKNARQELGISPDREEPSLLRSYLEQRIAVSDHKTMGQVGYMMAWGWEQAANTGNEQMLAFCGRMMTYVEQACLDGGKTQLAWLLTGLTEPNYQQLAVNRRKSTLSPFARLPAATWVAANVSYLKDIDTFETRLRQLGPSRVPPNLVKGQGDDPNPKRVPKKKRGKGGEDSSGPATDS